MGSPSRNVQYHPPRLSEDRLNLPQPHSPSLPTHCSGKSGMRPVPGDHDRNVPALRRAGQQDCVPAHEGGGAGVAAEDGDRAVRVSNGLSADRRIAFLPVNTGAGERTRTADLLITKLRLHEAGDLVVRGLVPVRQR